MAISKTTIVSRIEVYPAEDSSAESTMILAHPRVMVLYEDIIDDQDDAELPIRAHREKVFYKFVEDEGADTDVSGEDALVQSICAAAWS